MISGLAKVGRVELQWDPDCRVERWEVEGIRVPQAAIHPPRVDTPRCGVGTAAAGGGTGALKGQVAHRDLDAGGWER